MRRALALLVVLWLAPPTARSADCRGWRADGSGHAAADPGTTWSRRWSTPLAGLGHATPVRAGPCVLTTEAPTTLTCVDAEDGTVRWRHDHPVLPALDPAVREAVAAQVAEAPAVEEALVDARRALSAALRDARRTGGRSDTLDAARARLEDLESRLAAAAPYRNPAPTDDVGYAAATPATDGTRVWAVFANGVAVARRVEDGALLWSRWLGAAPLTKRGYTGEEAASPVLTAQGLLVPYQVLQALDPDTGRTLWRGPPWPDYGSPTVWAGSEGALVLSPTGQGIDAASGRVVLEDLGSVYYTNADASQDGMVFVGSAIDATAADGRAWAVGWSLTDGAGGPTAAERFRVALPTMDRVYAVPVHTEDHVFAITRHRKLLVLDRHTGAVVHEATLGEGWSEASAGPVVAGERVWFRLDEGDLFAVSTRPPFAAVGPIPVGRGRAAPCFEGTDAFVRDRAGLTRWATRP